MNMSTFDLSTLLAMNFPSNELSSLSFNDLLSSGTGNIKCESDVDWKLDYFNNHIANSEQKSHETIPPSIKEYINELILFDNNSDVNQTQYFFRPKINNRPKMSIKTKQFLISYTKKTNKTLQKNGKITFNSEIVSHMKLKIFQLEYKLKLANIESQKNKASKLVLFKKMSNIAQYFVEKMPPQWHAIQCITERNIKRDQSLNNLRNIIQHKYTINNIFPSENSSFVAPNASNIDKIPSNLPLDILSNVANANIIISDKYHFQFEDIQDIFQHNIAQFIKLNGEYCINPYIFFHPQKRFRNSKILDVRQVIEIFTVTNDSTHIPILVGQKGIRALRNIPKYTVLGQYIGGEFSSAAYKQVFEHTTIEAKHNLYSFDSEISSADLKQLSVDENPLNIRKFIIDPLVIGMNKELRLKYINDCRFNINNKEMNADDQRYKNVEFIVAHINGWASYFIMSERNIVAGEQLYTFYGSAFSDSKATFMENLAQQKNRKMYLEKFVFCDGGEWDEKIQAGLVLMTNNADFV